MWLLLPAGGLVVYIRLNVYISGIYQAKWYMYMYMYHLLYITYDTLHSARRVLSYSVVHFQLPLTQTTGSQLSSSPGTKVTSTALNNTHLSGTGGGGNYGNSSNYSSNYGNTSSSYGYSNYGYQSYTYKSDTGTATCSYWLC